MFDLRDPGPEGARLAWALKESQSRVPKGPDGPFFVPGPGIDLHGPEGVSAKYKLRDTPPHHPMLKTANARTLTFPEFSDNFLIIFQVFGRGEPQTTSPKFNFISIRAENHFVLRVFSGRQKTNCKELLGHPNRISNCPN